MGFSDQSHVNRVRDALWEPAQGAAVMVGAGFSRNAISKRQSGQVPPTWKSLAKSMHERLYPRCKPETEDSSGDIPLATSEALRLAQEFEAAFGRPALHRHLRELVSDSDFAPGNPHRQLLELRWRDVFTTNWDTLLERMAPRVKRSYSIVRNQDEIPLGASPRIVKLHGSVDARFPLISTEEDYRTYPREFAPFVNTVQQAMMETLLVLIGFSGDDPNFLHWSGWVRDNLGAAAPKIYLAGWLDLTIHRRRMLEERNIVPIDLARHPKAARWRRQPLDVRHAYATDWLLRSLEYGQPYKIENWPSPLHGASQDPPTHLRPLPRKPTNEPMPEPDLSANEEGSSRSKRDIAEELIGVWRYNRTKTYPGWLSTPSRVRQAMGTSQGRTEFILDVLPEMDAVARLRALQEVVWRWEIRLKPLSQAEEVSVRLAESARQVLSQVDCERQEIDGEAVPDADWVEISEAWVAVSLALATAARLRFDAAEFDQRLMDIAWFEDGSRDIAYRVQHEKCLWAIFELDYESLEGLLEAWHTDDCDPVWMMRKAALLFEFGRDTEARELNQRALHAARSVPDSDVDVSAKSREAWALYCSWASPVYEEYWKAATESWRRWAELAPLLCNASQEMQFCAEQIKGKNAEDRGPHFDLGRVWRTGWSISNAEYDQWLASHRAIGLAERAGLPPSAGNTTIAAANMQLAARQLWPHEPELAARLVLRAGDNDSRGALNSVLSRARVAVIPDEAVQRLADICIRGIEFIQRRVSVSDPQARGYSRQRLVVLMEALSRFVLRMDAQKLDSIGSKALGWYSNGDIAATVGIAGAVRNLLLRTWEALPDDMRRERVLDLIEAPIVGMEGFAAGFIGEDGKRHFATNYPDTWEVLARHGSPPVARTTASNSQRTEIVRLLAGALKREEEARERAVHRVLELEKVVNLTSSERSRIARALWGDKFADDANLPAVNDLLDWPFLVLPEPKKGIAENRFRFKWLGEDSLAEIAPKDCWETLWQVGLAIRNLRVRGRSFLLSEQEQSQLAELVKHWSEQPVPVSLRRLTGSSAELFPGDADKHVRNAIAGLRHVLFAITVPEKVAQLLYQKVLKLNGSPMPARSLYAGLVRVLPRLRDEIVHELRVALASDSSKVAGDASVALSFWLRRASEEIAGVDSPPTELVREIGFIVATRRKSALAIALAIAEWVFTHGSEAQREALASLVTEGLGELHQELRYGERQDEDIDVPLLRWRCAQLARSMIEKGFDSDDAVIRWSKEAANDPLPEMRHAGENYQRKSKSD